MKALLCLWGPMGAGKSTVGRRVAELAGVGFDDLDDLIEARAGRSIREIFETGEAAFRALERDLLLEQLKRSEARVLALGGGALVDDALRKQVLESAHVVTLTATVETLLSRTKGSVGRPLRDRLSKLLHERAQAYRDVHQVIDTDTLTPEDVARILAVGLRRPVC